MNILTKDSKMIPMIVNKTDFFSPVLGNIPFLCSVELDAGVEMKVIKNSILSRAAKKVGLDGLDEVFTGPTAVAFSNDDVVAPAKIIDEFAKDAKALEITAIILVLWFP